ncbi:TIGR00366 family protein [uncultured Algoriphagus sp.]|uniref:TIGR00366 family protein n=1 Tax=uncultured Algoriphagus sp. TaxID=417365 RepID=UPI0025982287|nr:TIGR00366 family protein [uncultured Algoriphagus sp.]
MKKNTRGLTFPSPFDIVLFLTVFVFAGALILSLKNGNYFLSSIQQTVFSWKDGFFSLLEFTLQMMIILVFGYSLALAKPVHSFLKKISKIPNTSLQAVLFTALITMGAGLLNWGFGLVVGALLARFVSLAMEEKSIACNSALLASAGYLGMAVWHGGLSGSATLKVAEQDHFLSDTIGQVTVDRTIFSLENLLITGGLVVVFLFILLWLNSKNQTAEKPKYSHPLRPIPVGSFLSKGMIVGFLFLLVFISLIWSESGSGLGFLNLNLVNFLLFGFTLFVYRDLNRFSEAVGEGIKSATDIFIQFPFYAGILGMVTQSGMIDLLASLFIDNANSGLLGVFTLFSAAIVNLLIPSGGGQWAVQGPIIMQASQALGIDPAKSILAFAYGDQISNLLQPFWALPLLAITGIKASQLIRYTAWLFLGGFLYLMFCLFFFFS